MVGIIVQLIISWLLLWLIEKRNLNALGLIPNKSRLFDLAIGLLIPLAYFSLFYFISAWLLKNPFHINPGYSFNDFSKTTWYLFKSVMFEELIFRGALLFILINRIGASRAIAISAIAFGIYHWFSWGLFGQPVPMIVTFLTTGLMGLVWAFAFYRTKSMYLPFALHFGVNLALTAVFSQTSSFGPQLLVPSIANQNMQTGILAAIILNVLYYLGPPGIFFLYIKSRKRNN